MVEYRHGSAFVKIAGEFDIAATFGCGQAFRWRALPGGLYEGVAGNHRAVITKTDSGISIVPCDETLFEGFWRHYLDLDRDYAVCAGVLSGEAALSSVMACCGGMRILNQPIWECLISFILSSNNNVRRISGIIEKLCERYGTDMGGYFAFPTPVQLDEAGEQGIQACGAGYRAAFIARTASAVLEGFDLDSLPALGYEAAKAKLIQLHGVGEKVADCVLLFSCGYGEAFPVDVWVKRSVPLYFPDAGSTAANMRRFAATRFGRLAGLAQQMIFHYERVVKTEKKTDFTA